MYNTGIILLFTDMFRAWVLDESQVGNYGDFPIILREVGRQKGEEMFLVS